MKILAIRVKNLASLEEAVIDFTTEPLKSAGIYAITGPTGSGKSTLLDALCLALFSKTPRHLQAKEAGIEIKDGPSGKIGQGDVRGILRKGCTEGSAEVEFIGLDGQTYKSTWSVRRSRNKADGNLQTDAMELTNMTSGTKFPEKKTGVLREIERLVGLNFEQFSRSVLLAQGDFTAFLKADKDEKASLLEKLTGTDIYSSISKLIYEKFKLAEQELKYLQAQVQGFTLLTEEELQEYHLQKEILQTKITGLDKEKTALDTEMAWHQVLQVLLQDITDAENSWNNCKKEKQEANERINLFLKVESVQDSRGLFESRAGINELGQQKNTQLAALSVSIQQLNEQINNAVAELESATIQAAQREKEYEVSVPSIEKAKVLDTLLKEKANQLAAVKEEWKLADQKRQHHQLKLKQKEQETLVLTTQLSELNKWKADNSSRQPIADNIALITSKLEDLKKLSVNKNNIIQKTNTIGAQISELVTTIATLETEITGKKTKLQDLTADLQTKNNLLEAVVIKDIKNELNTIAASLEKTILARGCWEHLFTTQQLYDVIFNRKEERQKELLLKKEEQTLQHNNLQLALVKKEQSHKLLSLARLENDKDVENMRTQLTDGDPCPVCGSIHHPYKGNNQQLQDLLEGVLKEDKNNNAFYDELVKECGKLDQLCVSLEQETTALEKDALIQYAKIQELTQKWQELEPDKRCLDLPQAQRLSWLNTEIEHLKTNIKELQDKTSNYDQLKEAADLQRSEIGKLEKELIEVTNHLKEKQRDHLAFNNELVRLKEELKSGNHSIDEIITGISPFFTHADWFNKWESGMNSFHQKIKDFAEDWNKKMQLLEQIHAQSILSSTDLNVLVNQLNSLEAESGNITLRMEEIKKNYSILQEQRNHLFNGELIDLVEQTLKQAIEQARTKQSDWLTSNHKLGEELTKAVANEEQLNKDLLYFQHQAEGLSRQIYEWLEVYNANQQTSLDESSLSGLLAYSPSWITDERKYLNQLENAITTAKATYDERNLQLSNHLQKRLSEHSQEEVAEKIEGLKILLETAIHEKNEIDFKIRQDTSNKKQVGNLLTEIASKHTVYENWQKLNDLLGSADGKKFRQIAQEYTLDTLLGYANIHLQVLSNRYKLSRIPDCLALQVIDKDMGDEIRSVHSLSGGESFLVSLALALGLASLSSNRMKVESLFIDEGFGSLDPATLSIAMDALERLQNQGRKVGVISHVQEMTERIQTQIRVSKYPNGKSKVEVTGLLV